MPASVPRLVADIGGTNARFALADSDGALHDMRSLGTHQHATLLDAARSYLAQCTGKPRHACFAVAGPVHGDRVSLTNHPWSFSVSDTRAALGLDDLRVINDFEAIAIALPSLAPAGLRQLGGGSPVAGRPKAVLGPGTGLGVAQLIETRAGFEPIATEGGHASIGPSDATELRLLGALLRSGEGVYREALLSGPGLERIYRIICEESGADNPGLRAAEIQARAVDGSNALCTAALEQFCAFLGTAAGDQALCCGAEGGVYLAGGILPRFGAFLESSRFRQRFEDKGPRRDYVRRIPVYLIVAANPGLIGAARATLQTKMETQS